MLEYKVYDQGAVIGAATAEPDGLYWQVHAVCRAGGDGFVRLYAHNGGKTQRLGVLIPEGDTLRLSRRIAASAFSFTDDTRISTSEAPQEAPAAEEVLAEPDSAAVQPEETAPAEEAAQEPDAQNSSEQWKPFSGTVLDYPIQDAQLKETDGGALLALRYEAGVEFPLMPLFCFCRLEEVNGQLCWLIELDSAGKPVMPDEKKPLTSGENVLE